MPSSLFYECFVVIIILILCFGHVYAMAKLIFGYGYGYPSRARTFTWSENIRLLCWWLKVEIMMTSLYKYCCLSCWDIYNYGNDCIVLYYTCWVNEMCEIKVSFKMKPPAVGVSPSFSSSIHKSTGERVVDFWLCQLLFRSTRSCMWRTWFKRKISLVYIIYLLETAYQSGAASGRWMTPPIIEHATWKQKQAVKFHTDQWNFFIISSV